MLRLSLLLLTDEQHAHLYIYSWFLNYCSNLWTSPIWLMISFSLVCLALSCALFHIYSGWSIPIFSNWWMSLRPKRSTSSSLNCEFRCLMSWVQRPPACLFRRSDPLNFVCWLYPHGEWAVVAWGLVDVRTALFRYDGLRAALFSSAWGTSVHFCGYAVCVRCSPRPWRILHLQV